MLESVFCAHYDVSYLVAASLSLPPPEVLGAVGAVGHSLAQRCFLLQAQGALAVLAGRPQEVLGPVQSRLFQSWKR